MARFRTKTISRRTVEALVVGKDTVFWDSELSGFGVRVYPSGSKVYVVQTRADGKAAKRVTVGRHGIVTAEEARRRAALIVARIKAGEEPVPEPLALRHAAGPTVGELARRWLDEHVAGQIAPSADAAGLIYALGHRFTPVDATAAAEGQVLGLSVSSPEVLEEAIPHTLEAGFDMLLLDGSAGLGAPWAELRGAPDLTILRDAVAILRRLNREEEIDLVYFGGVRSGTDAAKVIALGTVAVVLGVAVGLAAGGAITGAHELAFSADRTTGTVNIIKATASEASMMARCTGKTNLQNVELEDLRALTVATAHASGIPLDATR